MFMSRCGQCYCTSSTFESRREKSVASCTSCVTSGPIDRRIRRSCYQCINPSSILEGPQHSLTPPFSTPTPSSSKQPRRTQHTTYFQHIRVFRISLTQNRSHIVFFPRPKRLPSNRRNHRQKCLLSSVNALEGLSLRCERNGKAGARLK